MNEMIGVNKVVYLTYTILDQAGNIFEHSDLPVGYVHGAGSDLFEKIEQALDGKAVGDHVEVVLSPDEGFGPHDGTLTFTDDIENVPAEHRHIGSEVMFENERGEAMTFRVTKIEDDQLTIDANHPLAGQTVKFLVNVVSMREATLDEIANGVPDNTPPMHIH
jgi:FKBP-type peptidyl-prolyl cis-trans isomerase SlyD